MQVGRVDKSGLAFDGVQVQTRRGLPIIQRRIVRSAVTDIVKCADTIHTIVVAVHRAARNVDRPAFFSRYIKLQNVVDQRTA